jgi:hypothetical protein
VVPASELAQPPLRAVRLWWSPDQAGFERIENDSSRSSTALDSEPSEERIGQELVQSHRCSQGPNHRLPTEHG